MNINAARSAPADAAYGPLVRGIIGAVSMGYLFSTAGSGSTSAATIGAGMGLLAAVFSSARFLDQIAGIFYTAVGLIAFVPAAVDFVRSAGCAEMAPGPIRFAALALLVAVAATSLFAAVVRFGRRLSPAFGLAVFGGLEVLISAAAVLQTADSESDLLALAVMVPGAALLGWFAVTHADAVLGVATVAFGMQAMFAASIGSACVAANFSGAVVLVAFVVVFAIVRAVTGRFRT